MKYILFTIICFISASTCDAGFANDITISGKVTDFNEKRVCLMANNGVELQLPRKLVSEKIRLQPGRDIFLSLNISDFNQIVKICTKPRRGL